MNFHYYFEPRALKEYVAALEWYKIRSDKAAVNFVKEMDDALNTISKEPFRFRTTYKTFREISLKKYPFYVIYSIDEKKKQVLVFSIFHHKRNPIIKFNVRS